MVVRPEQRMWYFYALIVFFVAARALRRIPTVPLLGAAVIVNIVAVAWVLPAHLPLNAQWWGYVLQHWVFFVAAERLAGAYTHMAGLRSRTNGAAALVVFVVCGVVALATGVATNALVILVLSLAGTAVTLCVFPLVGDWRSLGWARAVGRRSLGVYAVHLIVMAPVVAVLAPYLPAFKGAGVVVPVAVCALVIVGAYGVTRALERVAPVPFLRVWWDTTARPSVASPSRAAAVAD